MEEAGIEIELKGILKMDHSLHDKDSAKFRVIFYAEPKNPNSVPKQEPDQESEGAEWVTLQEFSEKDKIRGDELIKHGMYVQDGGMIFPLSMFIEAK